jgi:V8-like Glu-specific endopeptidase
MQIFILFSLLVQLSVHAQGIPKRVIDVDDRRQINMINFTKVHESIGLIMTVLGETVSLCTGTVISKRHVITAAHCLVEDDKMPDYVIFIPAINSDLEKVKFPFGKFYSQKVNIIEDYKRFPTTENDLGLITFTENLPVPALPFGIIPSDVEKITIAGYPSDKTIGTLWESTGLRETNLFGSTTERHMVDTYSGQSGAALRAKINGVETIVGIHSGGYEMSFFHGEHNVALFLNEKYLLQIRSWMNN